MATPSGLQPSATEEPLHPHLFFAPWLTVNCSKLPHFLPLLTPPAFKPISLFSKRWDKWKFCWGGLKQEEKGQQGSLQDLMVLHPVTCTVSSNPHQCPGPASQHTDEKTEAQEPGKLTHPAGVGAAGRSRWALLSVLSPEGGVGPSRHPPTLLTPRPRAVERTAPGEPRWPLGRWERGTGGETGEGSLEGAEEQWPQFHSSYKNSVFNIHETKVRENLSKQSHFLSDLTVNISGIYQI